MDVERVDLTATLGERETVTTRNCPGWERDSYAAHHPLADGVSSALEAPNSSRQNSPLNDGDPQELTASSTPQCPAACDNSSLGGGTRSRLRRNGCWVQTSIYTIECSAYKIRKLADFSVSKVGLF